MFAEQRLRGLLHPLDVQIGRIPTRHDRDAAPNARGDSGSGSGSVARGGETRVKVVTDGLHPGDTDIVGKIAVRTKQPAAVAALAVRVEMHNLTGRMHTGVGATGADDLDRFVGDLA